MKTISNWPVTSEPLHNTENHTKVFRNVLQIYDTSLRSSLKHEFIYVSILDEGIKTTSKV